MGPAHVSIWDDWAPVKKRPFGPITEAIREIRIPDETKLNREEVMCLAEDTLSPTFPEKHVEENIEPNVTIISALMSSPYLMSATLNVEWLA